MTNPFVDLSGGVTRLNAQDGLFLRAEHLNEMEDYAKSLAGLVAQGGGPGVVYGYDLTLTASTLQITPGLAIDHNGMPLVSNKVGTLDLSTLPFTAGIYWVVGLVPGPAVPSGDENVYGSACDDACNGGTIQSNLTEGARVQLTSVQAGGLSGQADQDQRNWLASLYFKNEGDGSDAWLRQSVGLNSHQWGTGTPQPTVDNVVPLGVVWRGTAGLYVDQWTARRELVETPARRLWQSRLGMRPDSVFLAQICQFQAQLVTALGDLLPATSITQVVQWLDAARAGVTRHDETAPVQLLTSAISALSGTAPTGAAPVTLVGRGIKELPPAGYLPLIISSDDDLQSAIWNLFPNGEVDLYFRYCPIDFVAEQVQRAQHRDRIPLQNNIAKVPIEVIVPDDVNPGWVAFVRGRRPSGGDTSNVGDAVPVYFTTAASGVRPDVAAVGAVGSSVDLVGTVNFPVNSWASPESTVYQGVHQRIDAARNKNANVEITVVGVASSQERLPLAAVRATLMGTAFTPNPQMPEIQSVLASKEAIVVVAVIPAPSGNPR